MIYFLFFATFVFCQQSSSSSDEVSIIAHYQEKIEDRVIATGNVEIHYRNIKLFADRIELDTETKDVMAEGNVSVHFPEEVINCERIRFNLDSSQGELKKVFGRIQPTIFYEADTIRRKDQNLYNLQKAKITSCTQAVPRWRFSCSKANFKKDDYIEMWHSVLTIKKIPIFYLPYMRYPLNRERATGFLMPQLGYSGPKGLFYSQAFYLALKRNMDATLNMDYYSARGVGGGLEYRYIFSSGTGGNLRFYYFRFKQDPERENPTDAYIFRLDHNQPLPLQFSLVANVDYQSSFDFLREFDNNFKRAVVANRASVVYLSRNWSYFDFRAQLSRFETYFSGINHSVIKNTLPNITFSSSQMKIFSPLYFSFSSLFSRWEYGWDWDYERGTQKSSQSFNFKPVLTLPFTAIPWFTLSSSFIGNFNYYFQSYAPGSRVIVDKPFLSSNYKIHLESIGPVFYRIFFGAKGTPKLKHIIEPSITYHYESPISSSERIITASGFLFRFHQLTYSLTNRFLIKQNGMPREVFTLGVSQTYYLAPEESPLNFYRVEGKTPRFSDVIGYIRFYPSSKYTVDVSAAFNTYYKNFPRLRVGLNLGTMNDKVFCQVNWYKSINPYIENPLWDRHQISFFGGMKIPQLDLEARAAFDFNIQEKRMLYTLFSFVYSYQCLDFKAELKIFYFREKPETQFRISFGLGNIGKTTDFLGGY
ncbi:MAG: LPS-assembly protein LptD [Candidatus Aminicenantales bacterium]